MRKILPALLVLVATPALAQFPPPGIYSCVSEGGVKLGVLSLLVAGDYQWDTDSGNFSGQIASSGNNVEALSGPLGDAHWKGGFTSEAGETVFQFATDSGPATCRLPPA